MKRGGSKKSPKKDDGEKSNKRSVKIKRALIRTLSGSKGGNAPSISENNLVSSQLQQRQSFLHANRVHIPIENF